MQNLRKYGKFLVRMAQRKIEKLYFEALCYKNVTACNDGVKKKRKI